MGHRMVVLALLAAGTLSASAGAQDSAEVSRLLTPPWDGPIAAVSRGTVLQYAARLPWDSSFRASDQRILPAIRVGGRSVTPLARIEALRVLGPCGGLRRGRFVARIRSNGPYPPLGIRTGFNYVWVEGGPGDSLSALVYSADSTLPPLRVPLELREHPDPHPIPMARWWNNVATTYEWVTCCLKGCCCIVKECPNATVSP